MTKKHFPSGPFKISSFLFVFAALSSPAAVWAEAPVDFETLYNAADLSSVTEAAELPDMPKSYAVNYTLKGILTRAEGLPADAGGGQGKAFLHVADGRVFELELSDSKAKKYDGKSVIVLGKVKESDELSLLKVEEIAEYTPSSEEVVLPKFLAKRRPARLLADDGSVMTISNVRWSTGTILESEFDWATAKIRPDMIKNAYFVKKPFPPEWIAGHSLLLFTFKDGGLTDDKGNKSAGLVISVEAYLTEGQTYSITQGLKNNFFIVWTLATWEDYASRVVQYEKDAPKLILYPFNFGDSQKSALLRESLKQATVNRAGEYYHTVTNSCTNNLVIVINNVLPDSKKIRMWTIPSLVYNFRATMPVWVPPLLQKKGIIGGELPAIDINNFGSFQP